MTPKEIREKLIELLEESQPLKDFERLISEAVEAERRSCAALAYRYGCVDARDAILRRSGRPIGANSRTDTT